MTRSRPHELRSTDGSKLVVIRDAGLEIYSVPESQRNNPFPDRIPWTRSPLPLPSGMDPTTLEALCVTATEWSVDIVFQSANVRTGGWLSQIWRASPLRWRPHHSWDLDLDWPIDSVIAGLDIRPDHPNQWHWFAKGKTRRKVHEAEFTLTESGHLEREVTTTDRVYDVFLSYKNSDSAHLAKVVSDGLSESGISTWYAPSFITMNYQEEISWGISNSLLYVILLTEHSFDQAQSTVPAPISPEKSSGSHMYSPFARATTSESPRGSLGANLETAHLPPEAIGNGKFKMSQYAEIELIYALNRTPSQSNVLMFNIDMPAEAPSFITASDHQHYIPIGPCSDEAATMRAAAAIIRETREAFERVSEKLKVAALQADPN